MDLNTLWFILIAVLYTGYFILEGFDLGVGVLLPFLGKDDQGRRVILNTIGPHWDGNEVWLITAGGATFAAFPGWYATLFSGFYLPLLLILLALIFRGVGFEFRSKLENPSWRSFWDWAIFGGSLIPAVLWGVAFTNFILGVPVDAATNYTGGFWNLLNPFALMGGVISLLGFTLIGANFLALKTTGALAGDARRVASGLWIATFLLGVVFIVPPYFMGAVQVKPLALAAAALTAAAMLLAGWFIRQKRDGVSFIMTAVTILLASAGIFAQLFPQVLVSSTNPAWSLTIYNVSSSPYTLTVMSIVAAVFVPLVLVYQGWSYWIFRKRLSADAQKLEY